MNKYFRILKKYSPSIKSYNIVLNHSLIVLKKSIDVIARKKLYDKINFDLIISGCLLHDIGALEFVGNRKNKDEYILHGIIGGKILKSEKLFREAKIAERHIGSGISKKMIIEKSLPLPKRDFLPITLEEKLICYSDKFHSKNGKNDNLNSIKGELKKYGKEELERFLKMGKIFE